MEQLHRVQSGLERLRIRFPKGFQRFLLRGRVDVDLGPWQGDQHVPAC